MVGAVRYGSWAIDELLAAWRTRRYAGYRVKSSDITAFWLGAHWARLQGKVSKQRNWPPRQAMPPACLPLLTAPFAMETWHDLVTTTTCVAVDNPTFMIHVYDDPLYQKPLLLATDLALSAELIYLIYRDRAQWAPAVEQPPLAAKHLLGCQRQFVFAPEACYRLPELALLVGNMLTYLAALLPPMNAGFWDRTPSPTPGRLRRLLAKANFPNLADFAPELRKKNAVSDHLPKGVDAHRRCKPIP